MSDTRGGGRRAREGAGGVQSPYKYKYRRRPRLALMSCALPAVNAAPTTAPPRPGLPPGAGGRSHGGLPHPCARQTTHGGLPTPWRRHRALRPRRQGVVCSSHKDSRTRRTTHASKQGHSLQSRRPPPPLARDDGGGATAQGIFLRPSRQRLRAAPRWGCRGGGAPAAGRAARGRYAFGARKAEVRIWGGGGGDLDVRTRRSGGWNWRVSEQHMMGRRTEACTARMAVAWGGPNNPCRCRVLHPACCLQG